MRLTTKRGDALRASAWLASLCLGFAWADLTRWTGPLLRKHLQILADWLV